MNNIQYRFIKMDLTQFSPEWEQYNAENKTVGINTNFHFAFNKDAGIVKCETVLTFVQENRIFLKTALQTFYEIKRESIDEMTKETEIVIPKLLLCQFASLAYGSYRGILYMKTVNTAISDLVLPPLYLEEVIKEDLKIKNV